LDKVLESASVPVVIAVLGGLCVLAGIFGGMSGNIILRTLSRGERWGSGALGVLLLLVGSGMWLFPLLKTAEKPHQASASAIPTPALSSPPPPPSKAAQARITYPPHDGEPGAPVAVSRTRGLVVRGSVQGLTSDEHLWLFDFDPEDGRLYAVSEAPIPVSNGQWVKQDGPIGDPGVTKIQYVVVLRADNRCNAQLKAEVVAARKNDAEPFSLEAPPDGCAEDDRAPVNISKP
jgi:hypothetical protein